MTRIDRRKLTLARPRWHWTRFFDLSEEASQWQGSGFPVMLSRLDRRSGGPPTVNGRDSRISFDSPLRPAR